MKKNATRHETAVNSPSPKGSSSALPSTTCTPEVARASATMSALWSSPTASQPVSSARRRKTPPPQPTSRRRSPGAERKRCEHRLPGERVGVGRAVDLPRLPAVRAPRDPVGHPVDPPFTESLEHSLA